MIEFLRKFENRSIKIARVNSILITKFFNLQLFTLILYGLGVRCDLNRFSLLNTVIEKSMLLLKIYYYYILYIWNESSRKKIAL